MAKITCGLCGNSESNSIISVKEMMFNTREPFKYLKCNECFGLGLIDPPVDMEKFYPSQYYSFSKTAGIEKDSTIKKILKRSIVRGHLRLGNLIDTLFCKLKRNRFYWLTPGLVNFNSKILDVGCGTGFLIREMHEYGFKNLCGIDEYLAVANMVKNSSTVKISRTNLGAFEGADFDLIMYHHSFEHIQNPQAELKIIFNKLKSDGVALIRVPISDSYTFRKYQQYWYQLDAPRHYFLYSIRAIKSLCEQSGFELQKTIFDSNYTQFTGSECYRLGMPLTAEPFMFSKKEVENFAAMAKQLNSIRDGDAACFFLKKP